MARAVCEKLDAAEVLVPVEILDRGAHVLLAVPTWSVRQGIVNARLPIPPLKLDQNQLLAVRRLSKAFDESAQKRPLAQVSVPMRQVQGSID